VPGTIDPEHISGQDRFEFEVDGQVLEGWAELDLLSDGQTEWIKVALPAELERISAISHVRAGRVQPLDLVEITHPIASR
jgi:hypothetical protein